MQTDDRIIAGMDLGDVNIGLVGPRPGCDFHETFSGTSHLLAMYRSPALHARGRYLGTGRKDFTPIGPVFFRPAGQQLECRGKRTGADGLHCQFSDDRIIRTGFSTSHWTDRQLDAALDVQATHLFSYYARIINEIANPGFGSAAVIDSLLTIILTDLARYLAGSDRSQRQDELREQKFRMIVERICDVWEVMPRVSELAEMAGVGERQLLRLFRQRKGTSLAEFIRETRLEKARFLLGQTDTPLKQVAYRLGYSSHSTFTTAFRRDTGVTPATFRSRQSARHFVTR